MQMQQNGERRSIAALLLSGKAEIMRRWESLICAQSEGALRLDKLALQNSFPEIIDELVGALEPEVHSYHSPKKSGHHGTIRAAVRAYSLAQILLEFNLFRQAIFDTLEAKASLPTHERDVILLALEHELRDAVTSFAEARSAAGRNELERSKVSARALQSQVSQLEMDRSRQERFVATLSHDLGNPLGAASMAAEILTTHSDQDPELREFGQMLLRNLKRSKQMLRDLLDVARLSAGQTLLLHPERLDLSELASVVVRDLAAVYGARFELRTSGSLYGVWDRELLSRVVENLCTNAVKYGEKQSAIIVELAAAGGYATVGVHNQGGPISPQDQERIFEPFVRSSSAMESGVEGTGLGLALVKAVAEAHGGRVDVRSTELDGTTFMMTFPVQPAGRETDAAASPFIHHLTSTFTEGDTGGRS